MQALGSVGVLEKTEVDSYDGLLTSIYYFGVDGTINKYKDKFEDYMHKSNNQSIE